LPGDAPLGAYIEGVDIAAGVGAASLAEIKRAWKQHLVLIFRGQELTDPDLLAFSRNFGELDPPGPNPYGEPFLKDFPEINVISNVVENGRPIGNLGAGEAGWHADMTDIERPPKAVYHDANAVPTEVVIPYCAVCHR